MLKVFIADDKDLDKISNGIFNNKKCILKENVEFIKTKYVKEKKFEGGEFELGVDLIKKTDSISLAILDIYFDTEYGAKDKEGGRFLADLIQKHHPSCQIIIMTKSNTDPELLEEYEAFRDGRKFLSISKNHLHTDIEEYNKVFRMGLKEWLKLSMMSIADKSEKNLLIGDIENGTRHFFFQGLTLKDFQFFLLPEEFVASYFLQYFDLDIPPIDMQTLLNNVGISNKGGRCLIRHPLILYYYEFYNRPDYEKLMTNLQDKAMKYLKQASIVYRFCEKVKQDSYGGGSVNFKSRYEALAKQISSERLSPKGEINNPKEKSEIVKFNKRLWFRLFCLGLYFVQVSKSDIARFTNQLHKLKDEPSKDATKALTSNLWLPGFETTIDSYERDYLSVWRKLAKYEKVFLRQWFEIVNSHENDELRKYRNLEHILELI